ncbi:MAG: cation:proton antiporter, partial [Calditrichaeota bacterium]
MNSEIIGFALLISTGFLTIASFLVLLRLIIGPDITDRIVALDLFAFLFSGAVILFSVYENEKVFLNIIIILALVVFLGTVAFS